MQNHSKFLLTSHFFFLTYSSIVNIYNCYIMVVNRLEIILINHKKMHHNQHWMRNDCIFFQDREWMQFFIIFFLWSSLLVILDWYTFVKNYLHEYMDFGNQKVMFVTKWDNSDWENERRKWKKNCDLIDIQPYSKQLIIKHCKLINIIWTLSVRDIFRDFNAG